MGLILLLFLGLPSFQAMRSADYDSCHSDLDDLHSRSDDASRKAEDASDAETKLKRCRDDDENKSGCASELSQFESAQDDLESALDDVGSKVRSAASSCGVDFASPMTPEKSRQRMERTKQRFCRSLNGMRQYSTPGMLMPQCRQVMSEEECKRCLGLK